MPQDCRRVCFARIVLLFLALAWTVGCGDSKGRLQVTGTVKHPDGTVPKSESSGQVQFTPEDASVPNARGGQATIDKETGEFSLYTEQPGDGILPGKYKVTFRINKNYPPAPDGSSSVVPREYTQVESTPMSEVVDADHTRFELTVPKRGAAGKKPKK